jgi:hypothetical protein
MHRGRDPEEADKLLGIVQNQVALLQPGWTRINGLPKFETGLGLQLAINQQLPQEWFSAIRAITWVHPKPRLRKHSRSQGQQIQLFDIALRRAVSHNRSKKFWEEQKNECSSSGVGSSGMILISDVGSMRNYKTHHTLKRMREEP